MYIREEEWDDFYHLTPVSTTVNVSPIVVGDGSEMRLGTKYHS